MGVSSYSFYNSVEVKALSFEGAFYHLNESSFPFYQEKIRLPKNVSQVDVNVDVLETIALLPEENKLLKTDLPDTTLSWRISNKKYLTNFTGIPFHHDAKVSQFKYSIDLTYKELDDNPKNNFTNSVL